MQDNLAIINRVIEEHRRIHGSVQMVGSSMNDVEAVFKLQQAYSGWTLTSKEAISQRQDQLIQTMAALDSGLNNHFAFEEYNLPPLFGNFLMQALLLEHNDMRSRVSQVKATLTGLKFSEMPQPELLSRKTYIQGAINGLLQTIEEHAAREEVILNMLKKALEKK